ncbi:MAG: hypothetical protein JWQ49_5784 [Edaphobacter sp.]|nr:hypothetical protein [Edaphobacter sp.]
MMAISPDHFDRSQQLLRNKSTEWLVLLMTRKMFFRLFDDGEKSSQTSPMPTLDVRGIVVNSQLTINYHSSRVPNGRGCVCQNLSCERFRVAVEAGESLWQEKQERLLPMATEEMSA